MTRDADRRGSNPSRSLGRATQPAGHPAVDQSPSLERVRGISIAGLRSRCSRVPTSINHTVMARRRAGAVRRFRHLLAVPCPGNWPKSGRTWRCLRRILKRNRDHHLGVHYGPRNFVVDARGSSAGDIAARDVFAQLRWHYE
jgi:hypothetical protein